MFLFHNGRTLPNVTGISNQMNINLIINNFLNKFCLNFVYDALKN